MSSLIFPDDIMVEILSRLPVKPIMRFRCVCKTWCKLLRSNNCDFVQKHLNHNVENNNLSLMISNVDRLYSIDDCDLLPDNVSALREIENYPNKCWDYQFSVWLIGSCNGLLCIFHDTSIDSQRLAISIWNPCTKEYKVLPQAEKPEGSYPYINYGFGYDCKIKDYKLVRIVSFNSSEFSQVSIITLGSSSSSWERIQDIPCVFFAHYYGGLLVNGALHWIVSSCVEFKGPYVIVVFDVSDDRFHEMALPVCSNEGFNLALSLLGGSICLFHEHINEHYVDVWVMKDYGAIESWIKHFTISKELELSSITPILSLKNGEILLRAAIKAIRGKVYTHDVVSYDPNHERFRTLEKLFGSITQPFFDTTTYVGSLISLNTGTYVEQSKMRTDAGL